MAESELLCVRVATLLRNKYASVLRVMSQGSTCHVEISAFLKYFPGKQKKNRHCSDHNLGTDKLKS